MSTNYDRSNNTRAMILPATAGTYYPTCVELGLMTANLTLKVSTDTVTTTQGSSYYRDVDQAATVGNIKKRATLRRIITLNATAGNVTIEGHNGTAIIPTLAAPATALTVLFDEREVGITITGGFRIVTSANTALMLVFEDRPR